MFSFIRMSAVYTSDTKVVETDTKVVETVPVGFQNAI